MDDLHRKIKLFHYNIWRFERWTRYLIVGKEKPTSIQNSVDRENELDDYNPVALRNELPNYQGKHFSILVLLVLLTAWNFLCGLLDASLDSGWFWGMIVAGILSFIGSYYLAPPDRRRYLSDFVKFESMTRTEKRKSALLTMLVVAGIWGMFIASFVFFLRY